MNQDLDQQSQDPSCGVLVQFSMNPCSRESKTPQPEIAETDVAAMSTKSEWSSTGFMFVFRQDTVAGLAMNLFVELGEHPVLDHRHARRSPPFRRRALPPVTPSVRRFRWSPRGPAIWPS